MIFEIEQDIVTLLEEFLDILLSAYTSATTEFEAEYEKLKKARNIKKIMDWE